MQLQHELGIVLKLNNEQLLGKVHMQLMNLEQPVDVNLSDLLYSENSSTAHLCEHLSTGRRLQAFVSQHFKYVAPEEHILGCDDMNKPETMHYVPILDTLKALPQHQDVLGQVLQDHRSEDQIVRDFCDGEVYKDNPLFQQHPRAVHVELYNDEFTCTNPLRQRSKKRKISASCIWTRMKTSNPSDIILFVILD